jgi:hypothetical protein
MFVSVTGICSVAPAPACGGTTARYVAARIVLGAASATRDVTDVTSRSATASARAAVVRVRSSTCRCVRA